MTNRSCVNCYFYDDCNRMYRKCGYFTPIVSEELSEEDINEIIENGRIDFYESFWSTMREEDRMQDYFG